MGKNKGVNLIEPTMKSSTRRKSRIGDISERSSILDQSSKNGNSDAGDEIMDNVQELSQSTLEMNNIQEEKNEDGSDNEDEIHKFVIGAKQIEYKNSDSIFYARSPVTPI